MMTFMRNHLKHKDISIDSPCTLSAWQDLAKQQFSDKVLHENVKTKRLCNTLSEVHHAAKNTRLSFFPATMLDDQAARHGDGVFSTFDQKIPRRSWLLQQLYPQREVVYFTYDSSFRQGRGLVLRRCRFFTFWQLNSHTHQPDPSKPSRNDSGTARREAPLSLPLCLGSAIPPRKNSTPEAGTFIHLPGNGSFHSNQTTSGTGRKKCFQAQTPCRDCGVDSGGVYPPPRFQLRTTGQSDCTSSSYRTRCRSDSIFVQL